ncbi:MAG: hypothetical protein U9O06_05340 [Euryarchaeota archaeon]|nr:hypothetical protein [Euryarchaeota archaeon]
MTLQQFLTREFNLQNAGFSLAWILTLVLLLPVQLASIILFDSTGLDTIAPDLVFTVAVPAIVLTLPPTVIADRLYTPRATHATAAVAFVAFGLIAAYTVQFYGMCGLGC